MSFAERIREQLSTDALPEKDYFAVSSEYEKEILTGIKWEITPYRHRLMDEHCPYKQRATDLRYRSYERR